MKRRSLIMATLISLLLSSAANAARFEFDGHIAYHNDVAFINFSLENDATDVRVYTDSFNFGIDGNFDPITALWTGGGTLLAQNDDIETDAFNWDSGFFLPSLETGDYMFTVAAYNNFVIGTDEYDGSFSESDNIMLSNGFLLGDETQIPIEEWALFDGAGTTGMSGYYHVVLDGVDHAHQQDPSAAPEPATMFLLGSGLTGVAVIRKRFRK